MSDVTIDLNGASELEVRQLQTLVKMIDPEALPKFGIDGDLGGETRSAVSEILGEHAQNLDENISLQGAIAELQSIALMHAPAVDVSDAPISEASKADLEHIQGLVNIIDPSLIPKGDIDGVLGPQTLGALEGLLPEGTDLDTVSLNEIITQLDDQIINMPERHHVDDCENLTVIAREHYQDDIDAYTEQLMDTGLEEFDTEAKARVHAEQIAVTKIAVANNDNYQLAEGDNAHTLHPDWMLEIPPEGDLKDVDATLDWEALDAAVGPGGPCGCDDVKTPFMETATPGGYTPVPEVVPPRVPNSIELGEDCTATYIGERPGLLGLGELKHTFQLEGTSGEGFHDLKQHVDDPRSYGSCRPEPEGGDNDSPGGKTSSGLSDGPVGGGTTGLN